MFVCDGVHTSVFVSVIHEKKTKVSHFHVLRPVASLPSLESLSDSPTWNLGFFFPFSFDDKETDFAYCKIREIF